MNKFEGYFYGIPLYSNPACPKDTLYFIPDPIETLEGIDSNKFGVLKLKKDKMKYDLLEKYDPYDVESLEAKYNQALGKDSPEYSKNSKETVRTIASAEPLFLSQNDHIMLVAGFLATIIAFAGFLAFLLLRLVG